jgi:hypothetical protein
MKIFFAVLGGTAGLALFIFVAFSVNRGFEEIVVGGLGLIYVAVRFETKNIRDQLTRSHLALLRATVAAANNIKEKYLKEETESTARESRAAAEEILEKEVIPIGIQSLFAITMTVLSFGLIIKGAMV